MKSWGEVGATSTVRTVRFSDCSALPTRRSRVVARAVPPPEATSRVSCVPPGFTIRAPSISRFMICLRASASPATVRGSSGEPGSRSSRPTVCPAAAPGAATPKGTSVGFGWCSAPT